MTCRYCGAEAPEGASFCGNCGASLLDGNNQSTMPNNFNSTYNSNPNNVNKKDVDGLGIASMVLGILALLCTCSSILPLIFSIIAIILACIDKRRSGMRTAGLVLGIIGLVLVLLLTGIGILYRSGKDDVKTKIEDDLNEYYNSSKTDNSESSTNKDRSALYNNSYLYGDWYQFGPNELLTNGLRVSFNTFKEFWYFPQGYNNFYSTGKYEIKSVDECIQLGKIDESKVNALLNDNKDLKREELFVVVLYPEKAFVDNKEVDSTSLQKEVYQIWGWTDSSNKQSEFLIAHSGNFKHMKQSSSSSTGYKYGLSTNVSYYDTLNKASSNQISTPINNSVVSDTTSASINNTETTNPTNAPSNNATVSNSTGAQSSNILDTSPINASSNNASVSNQTSTTNNESNTSTTEEVPPFVLDLDAIFGDWGDDSSFSFDIGSPKEVEISGFDFESSTWDTFGTPKPVDLQGLGDDFGSTSIGSIGTPQSLDLNNSSYSNSSSVNASLRSSIDKSISSKFRVKYFGVEFGIGDNFSQVINSIKKEWEEPILEWEDVYYGDSFSDSCVTIKSNSNGEICSITISEESPVELVSGISCASSREEVISILGQPTRTDKYDGNEHMEYYYSNCDDPDYLLDHPEFKLYWQEYIFIFDGQGILSGMFFEETR